jgi:hypothetical protein
LNVVQLPRRPVEYDAFEQALQFDFTTNTLYRIARRWQLSSTQYILGAAPMVSLLNQVFDPEHQSFKPVILFDFYQDRQGGPILTRTNSNGPYAVIEFGGTLPRAKLYTDWKVVPYDAAQVKQWTDSIRKVFPPNYPLIFDSVPTNDLATIEVLTRAAFDPAQTVLLADPLKTAPPTNATPGTVEYVSYKPKHIVLKTKSATAGVLLLNDKYDASWHAFVDGQPTTLLRCNYLMRGVEVPQGDHQVEFRFQPPVKFLYVSVAAIVLALGLTVFLLLGSATGSTAFAAPSGPKK